MDLGGEIDGCHAASNSPSVSSRRRLSIWIVAEASRAAVAADWTSGSDTSDPHDRQNLEWSGTGVLQ
jgi:hypothetical protein